MSEHPRTDSTPGRHAAAHARRAIERSMLAIRHIPLAIDRPELSQRLGRAVQCCYAVIDSEVIARVHYDGLEEAGNLVAAARALLPPDGGDAPAALREACDELGLAASALKLGVEQVAQLQLARRLELHGGRWDDPVPPARPFRASHSTPSCHAMARRPLAPPISLDPLVELPSFEEPPPPPAPPRDLEELAALVAAGPPRLELDLVEEAPAPEPVWAYHPAVHETEWLWRLGRSLLEDVALGRDLRRPNEVESWLDQAPFEETLLARFDAFVALGEAVLPLVSLYHAEADAPDPGRAFAAALVLGSIEGADCAGAAVAIFRTSPPEELEGWIEGFALAASRDVDEAMADLTGDARVDLAAAAVTVLATRGTLGDALLRPLCRRREPELASAVTRALAAALHDDAAVAELELRACEAELAPLALEALVQRSCKRGRDLLRASFAAAPSAPLHTLLCLAGEASDAETLLHWARSQPSIEAARALGRFGHANAIPVLLDLLELGDGELAVAAAEALERISGAHLLETVELPWDFELPPNTEELSGVPIPTRRVERPTVDPEAWRRWLRQRGHRLDPGTRWRSGQPFTLRQVADELESALTPPARRPEVALELRIRLGTPFRFACDDWVARQREHLVAIHTLVERAQHAAGTWDVAAIATLRTTPDPAADDVEKDPLMGTMMVPEFFLTPDGKALPFLHGRAVMPEPVTIEEASERDPLGTTMGSTLAPDTAPPASRPRAALPFDAPEPPPSRPEPPSRRASPPSAWVLEEPHEPRAPSSTRSLVDSTGEVPPLSSRPALPFGPSSTRSLVDSTGETPPLSSKPVLPFAPVPDAQPRRPEEPRPRATPFDHAAPAPASLRGPMDRTDPLGHTYFGEGESTADKAKSPIDKTLEQAPLLVSDEEVAAHEDAPSSRTPDLLEQPPASQALPFVGAPATRQSPLPAAPVDGGTRAPEPRLSLERFAWLSVREPYGAEHLMQALTRCGVRDLAEWQRWKAYWGARISGNPALRARWEQAVAQYRAR